METRRARKPPWIKAKLPGGQNYAKVKALVRAGRLNTVCQSARCPNLAECWEQHTATFMILGGTCTRSCGFCAVPSGRPDALDRSEPARVAEAVRALGLRYAVITSVTRDDLPLGGAELFAATVRAVRQTAPRCKVEVLVPDFCGSALALQTVLEAGPDVLNHNVETVPRLYPAVRPRADYSRSLELLRGAHAAGTLTKSGLMVGLGERHDELLEVFSDLRAAGCAILTLGQYLSPGPSHLPVARFYEPGEFEGLRREALEMGFAHVEAGPLVRSSYRAHEQARGAGNA